jgi:predicted amidophosphoribosyltransferase
MIGPPPSATRVFDTTRSPLGELLYKLKNRGDEAVVPEIVDTAATFVKGWAWRIDAIVPVPPSNTARKRQSVIANALSEMLGLPVCDGCMTKVKSTGR